MCFKSIAFLFLCLVSVRTASNSASDRSDDQRPEESLIDDIIMDLLPKKVGYDTDFRSKWFDKNLSIYAELRGKRKKRSNDLLNIRSKLKLESPLNLDLNGLKQRLDLDLSGLTDKLKYDVDAETNPLNAAHVKLIATNDESAWKRRRLEDKKSNNTTDDGSDQQPKSRCLSLRCTYGRNSTESRDDTNNIRPYVLSDSSKPHNVAGSQTGGQNVSSRLQNGNQSNKTEQVGKGVPLERSSRPPSYKDPTEPPMDLTTSAVKSDNRDRTTREPPVTRPSTSTTEHSRLPSTSATRRAGPGPTSSTPDVTSATTTRVSKSKVETTTPRLTTTSSTVTKTHSDSSTPSPRAAKKSFGLVQRPLALLTIIVPLVLACI